MIGLILGTSEGKEILRLLGGISEQLFVSTATEYGSEELNGYKYAQINSKPLDYDEFVTLIRQKNIETILDASHPYAVQVTRNVYLASKKLGIEYVRYERPSCVDRYMNNEKVIVIDDYTELKEKLKGISGCILNTTGSRNIGSIVSLELNNRIVHRVLPSNDAINECCRHNIKTEDIVALKGPVSCELNRAFIKEYKAAGMILKDSGPAGGTPEKLEACIYEDIYAFVLKRHHANFDDAKVFKNVQQASEYLLNKHAKNTL